MQGKTVQKFEFSPYRVHVEAPVDEGQSEPLGAPGHCESQG